MNCFFLIDSKIPPLFFAWEVHLRLAIGLVLRSEFAALVAFFAVCCSSFVPINRGTGDRSILTPEGNEQIPSVRRSNKLMSRPGGLTFKFPMPYTIYLVP